MTNLLHAKLTENGYVLSDNGLVIGNKIRNLTKKESGLPEIYVVLTTGIREDFYPKQEVMCQGEKCTIESLTENGWASLVGIAARVRVSQLSPAKEEIESYYSAPSDKDLIEFIKIKFDMFGSTNRFKLFFGIKKRFDEIRVALNMLRGN